MSLTESASRSAEHEGRTTGRGDVDIDTMLSVARSALDAAPPVGDDAYRRFARSVGSLISSRWSEVVAANQQDLTAGREAGLPGSRLGRIELTEDHRERMAALAETVQQELTEVIRPGRQYHGLGGAVARRIPKPLGVVLMVYEARPTVTVDGALLPVCAGNAVLLRGGSEIGATNAAISAVFAQALEESGLPAGMIQVLSAGDRSVLRALLRRDDAIDVLIPRGSPSLIDACRATSHIPMIVGGDGVNHQYIHQSADLELAVRLVLDGKMYAPEGCTALEMILLDDAVAATFLESLAPEAKRLAARTPTLRVSQELMKQLSEQTLSALDVQPLAPSDEGREFLDTTLAVRSVPDLDAAVAHIKRFGTNHTEGIVTGDAAAADEFCRRIDAAALVVNGSVRLHDGPTLGLGTEIAISTGRLQVRGPVTLDSLMTYSWRVDGNGASRFLGAQNIR